MQNQVINLENLIDKLKKNLKDIYVIEKEIIRIDQLLIAGRNTEMQLKQKLNRLNQNLQNYLLQKENLQKIRNQSIQDGFRDLPRNQFEQMQEKWKEQNPQALSIILRSLSQISHLYNQFYMIKNKTLRIIGRDQKSYYHFKDIQIPQSLNL